VSDKDALHLVMRRQPHLKNLFKVLAKSQDCGTIYTEYINLSPHFSPFIDH
jgi:hypothetical protein